jgi:hypothetical protein
MPFGEDGFHEKDNRVKILTRPVYNRFHDNKT